MIEVRARSRVYYTVFIFKALTLMSQQIDRTSFKYCTKDVIFASNNVRKTFWQLGIFLRAVSHVKLVPL